MFTGTPKLLLSPYNRRATALENVGAFNFEMLFNLGKFYANQKDISNTYDFIVLDFSDIFAIWYGKHDNMFLLK